MANTDFERAALFEHRFWLQILGDHARFIYLALSPLEQEKIEWTERHIHTFEKLLVQSRQPLTETELMGLTRQAFYHAHELKTFKLNLLRLQLEEKIYLSLSPTFLNHMVNEIDEYLRLLNTLSNNEIPTINPVHQHLLWLLDAIGHSATIINSIDQGEKKFIARCSEFKQNFEALYLQGVEMAGYCRTKINHFSAFNYYSLQVESEMQQFKNFLSELLELTSTRQVLSTLSTLLLDHIARESCYYLVKLAQASHDKMPVCDPTRPRKE